MPMNLADKRRELARRLQRLGYRMQSVAGLTMPEKLIPEIERQINKERWLERILENRFQRQSTRSTGGRKWARLKKSTIRERVRLGFGAGPILQRTGRLKRGALAAARGRFRLDRPQITFDESKLPEYGQYHQEGGGKLPRRAFLDTPTRDELEPAFDRARALIRLAMRRLLDK